jgi:hypothetical protein
MINWYKFLLNETSRNFFDRNVGIIYHLPTDSFKMNITSMAVSEMESSELSDLLKEAGVAKILNEYQIDKLLGMGAKGLAFTLKYPHENYILKFQIDSEEEFRAVGEVGTEYPSHLYKKQEKDIYDPKEMRVLESKRGWGENNSGEKFHVSVTVMSKASEEGITAEDTKLTPSMVYRDIFLTKIKYLIMNFVDYLQAEDKIRKDLAKQRVGNRVLNLDGITTKETERIMYLLEIKDFKNVFRLLYNVFSRANLIQHLSLEQYVGLCMQLYKIIDESYVRTGHHVALDLHSGNFGFRPNSDIPIFFDI